MNFTLLILFTFFGIGCSNQEDEKTDELTTIEFRGIEAQEPQLISEPLLHQVALEQELSFLNCQRENLLVDVENERPGAVAELEENQYLTELNHRNSEYLDETIAKRIPCRPGRKCPKPKPNPCGEEKGCDLNCPIMIPDFFSLITTTSNIDIRVVTDQGEICGRMEEMEQIGENLFEATIETGGCCNAFLEVSKEFESAPEGEISYRIPITCNQ